MLDVNARKYQNDVENTQTAEIIPFTFSSVRRCIKTRATTQENIFLLAKEFFFSGGAAPSYDILTQNPVISRFESLTFFFPISRPRRGFDYSSACAYLSVFSKKKFVFGWGYRAMIAPTVTRRSPALLFPTSGLSRGRAGVRQILIYFTAPNTMSFVARTSHDHPRHDFVGIRSRSTRPSLYALVSKTRKNYRKSYYTDR